MRTSVEHRQQDNGRRGVDVKTIPSAVGRGGMWDGRGIVRPVETIDFEDPGESWLEPLLVLVREAIGAMRPGG
jgi:hypothetical protein